MSDQIKREAGFVRQPAATVMELREELERQALAYIANRNPGIDLEEVKAHRQSHGHSWTVLDEELEYTDHLPDDPLLSLVCQTIDNYTSAHGGYVMDFPTRDGLAKAIAHDINSIMTLSAAMAGTDVSKG